MKPKFYVYGCQKLLLDLRELIDSAADYEESGKTAEEWLKHQGFTYKGVKAGTYISWGTVINTVINNSTNELLRMEQDINYCKSLGINGVVFGILNQNQMVDVLATERLVNIAFPLKVTFHKAIDEVSDIMTELEKLISISGITSILSSGGHRTAIKGADVIKSMIQKAKNHLSIIPAGGITNQNIEEIHSLIGAREYHGRKIVGDLN